MISYIYFSEQGECGVGNVYEDDIQIAKDQITEEIRMATDARHVVLTSKQTNFVEELKKYSSIDEYADVIISQLTKEGSV